MPKCDGCQATKGIRDYLEAQGVQAKPFICCLTAYQEDEYMDAALKSGMNQLLVKPTNSKAIKAILVQAGILK